MPPDRSRSSNPQGRQKSCSECAKAKRKCDLQQPNCLRCTRQKLTCNYPPQPHTSSTTTPSTLADTPTGHGGAEHASAPFEVDLGVPTAPDAPDADLLDFDFTAAMNSTTECDDCRTCQPYYEGGTVIEMPTPPSQSAYFVPPTEFSSLMLTQLAESRVGYSIQQMKLMPRMMVEENATLWCHPKLYEDYMPKSLQDAYASCALYISRTETNSTFVARHVTERAQELMEQTLPTPPIEILARAQAFLLYQIILICSGDIRCYGQAESLIPHLEESGATILAISSHDDEPLGELPLYPSNAARSAWTSYIFRESCRRTLLAVFHSVAVCNLMRGRMGTCAHHLAVGNRITISAALWAAKSPFDFAIAWNEKKHFLVKELDFNEVLRKADADDVDEFGRMMMIGLMGVDDVKGWLHTRGGELQGF